MSNTLAITSDEILRHTQIMLQEREDRSMNLSSNNAGEIPKGLLQQLQEPQSPMPTAINTSQAKKTAESPPRPIEALPPFPQDMPVQRDDGVSDEIWSQLQIDAQAQRAQANVSADTIRDRESEFETAAATQRGKLEALKKLEQAKAQDEAQARELKQKQEQARLEELAARQARQKAKEEREKLRLKAVMQRREEQVQARLRQMGVCPMGYQWIKQSGGYRCSAGGHFVTNGQLGLE